MGHEYQITYTLAQGKQLVRALIEKLPYSISEYCIEERVIIHLFDDSVEDEMPIASLEVHDQGLYCCIHGQVSPLREELVELLSSAATDVQLHEL